MYEWMNVLKYVSTCHHLTGMSETVRRARVRECARGIGKWRRLLSLEGETSRYCRRWFAYIHTLNNKHLHLWNLSLCMCGMYVCRGLVSEVVGPQRRQLCEAVAGAHQWRWQKHTYIHTYIHTYCTCRSIKIILRFVSARQYFRFGIPTRSSFWSPLGW